jgi:hypothetical protein
VFLTPAPHADGFVEYANATETVSETPIDMHAVIKSGNMPEGVSDKQGVAQAMLSVDRWLPFAAENYGTSANINDYIVVPSTIFLTDIPNANLAAFPFEEMSAWNHNAGRVTYRTWKGKPTHEEHANQDPTVARGVIFDSSMKSVPNYVGGLHRVVLLAGWDRNRFPELAARVQAGRHGFSMGAWVSDYNCSVCNASMRAGGCGHIHPKHGVMVANVGNKLTYRIARGVTGFELSAVRTPAWRSAYGQPIG